MQRVCRQLADRAYDADGIASPYALLGKWVHMLGFRGHFSTKSRRYSITLGALRRARARWQALAAQSRRTGEPIDLADLEARLLADDEEETTLVVGHWVYVGTRLANRRRRSPRLGRRRPGPRVRPSTSRKTSSRTTSSMKGQGRSWKRKRLLRTP